MQFAYIPSGLVAEIITLPRAEVDIFDPPTDPAGEPVLAVRAGEDVPISRCYHPDYVAMCVSIPGGTVVAVGDRWSADGGFTGPPPTPVAAPPSAAEVLAQRDALLAIATLRVDPLVDAVELDVATPGEIAALKAWKQYRVALNRIEQQPGFPTAVDWPQAPA